LAAGRPRRQSLRLLGERNAGLATGPDVPPGLGGHAVALRLPVRSHRPAGVLAGAGRPAPLPVAVQDAQPRRPGVGGLGGLARMPATAVGRSGASPVLAAVEPTTPCACP